MVAGRDSARASGVSVEVVSLQLLYVFKFIEILCVLEHL